jgi:Protein of unknown function (DUF1214)
MSEPTWDMTRAWRELLDGLAELDVQFLEGPRAVGDERAVAEGYRMLTTGLSVALDVYLYVDPGRPLFVDCNTPFRRDRSWGGDNTDAYYSMVALDPQRRYRVSGQQGDSTYFSLTVYNEPGPGQWSNRVVGIVNDSDLDIDGDGRFAFSMGPSRPAGHVGPFIELSDDTHMAFTRDYQLNPATGRRVIWEIEALDPPEPIARTDADTAAALRAALTWIQTLFLTVPLTVAPRDAPQALGHNSPQLANEFADPYQVPDANFGWSARDACYAFASYRIDPGEALVITHRPPDCRFWNLVVWNPFLATEVLTDAHTSINNGAARTNSDGTITIVVAHEDQAHPNAVSTAGHADGSLAFRWFLADVVPGRPAIEVVPVSDAPTEVT